MRLSANTEIWMLILSEHQSTVVLVCFLKILLHLINLSSFSLMTLHSVSLLFIFGHDIPSPLNSLSFPFISLRLALALAGYYPNLHIISLNILLIHSYLSSIHPSFLPSFHPSIIPSFIPSFLPSFIPSFLPSIPLNSFCITNRHEKQFGPRLKER